MRRRCALIGLLVLVLGVMASPAQAGNTIPRGVSPANEKTVPFGAAVVFGMTPEPEHLCSEYYLALDAHADVAHLGPRFSHPSCTVVVPLGSKLRAEAEHTWRVWRNCTGVACNGPGESSHRSPKRRFYLDGPTVGTTPKDGATIRDLAFPVQLKMSPETANAPFEIRISSSKTTDALGRLADPERTIPTSLSPSLAGTHLALVSGLEPGLYYWQWVRLAPACDDSAIDCPSRVLRLLLDPSGELLDLDIEAPRVRPLAAKGRVGKRLKLRYSVRENLGQGRVNVWIYRKTKARKRWNLWLDRVEPRRIFHVVWTPRKPGRYRLCTRGRDGAQNVSKKRCSRVKIAPRPAPRP